MALKKYYFIFLLFFIKTGFTQSLIGKKRFTQDTVYISFINTFKIPIETNISPKDSLKTKIRVNKYQLLAYLDTIEEAIVIPLNMIEDTSKIKLNTFINFEATFGNPKAKPDDSLYALPFQKGKRIKIIQSFGGKFSHDLKSSYYAIDFGTQIGDTITAARNGTVFYTKEDSKEHCRTRKCMNKANKILVLHSDGTYANYVHLDYNGALVEPGDKVKTGQVIGISGMTGFTTIPHLHFVVHQSNSESIPIYFRGIGSKKLKPGKKYKRRK